MINKSQANQNWTLFYIKIIIRYHKTSMFFGKGGEGVTSCVAVFFHRVF